MFETRKDPFFEQCLFGALNNLNLQDTSDFLCLAFDFGGFLAGGFARSLGLTLIDDVISNDRRHFSKSNSVSQYIAQNVVNPTSRQNDNLFLRKNYRAKSDVDIWFEDEKSLNNFLNSPKLKSLIESRQTITDRGESIANCARNFEVNNIRVQVITKFLGKKKDLLSHFDITNCMIALDRDGLIFSKKWIELEKSKTLDINRWKTDWVLNRIVKYMTKPVNSLNHITPATAAGVYDQLCKAYLFFGENEHSEWIKTGIYRRYKSVRNLEHLSRRFSFLFKSLTNEQLLYLSCLTPKQGYDHAFPELCRRNSVKE